ncbi:hypothetical protein MNBD_ALPHA08-1586 [hydrothermal vent metagenome]|uniref:Uncharacterized protein n=1 Tax=hydrothermal vent metagenome TaxID=652676 RepID=A0A3B0RAN7_9ZZZZ
MIKIVFTGLWISLATLGSLYGVVIWQGGKNAVAQPQKFFGGLDYVKTDTISVPIISKGEIAGYVLARFVYLADGRKLKLLSVPADLILADEAFRIIYAGSLRDFRRIERYDLAALTKKMRESANKRFETNLIEDILIDSINYIPKSEVRFRGPPEK